MLWFKIFNVINIIFFCSLIFSCTKSTNLNLSGNNSVNTTSAQDSNQNVSSQFKILIIASDDLPSTTQSLGLTDPTATSTNAKTNTLVTGGNAGGKGDFTSKIKIAIALSNKYPNIQICK